MTVIDVQAEYDARFYCLDSVWSVLADGPPMAVFAVQTPPTHDQTLGTFLRTGFEFYPYFISFDTSFLPANATIQVAEFHSKGLLIFAPANMELREYDFGPTLEASDWLTQAAFAACPKLATIPDLSLDNTMRAWTNENTMISGINKAGHTRFVIAPGAYANGLTPIADSGASINSNLSIDHNNRPYLHLEYTVASGLLKVWNGTSWEQNR
jgi:hypothetical protein